MFGPVPGHRGTLTVAEPAASTAALPICTAERMRRAW